MSKVVWLVSVFGVSMIAGGVASLNSDPTGGATAVGIGAFVLGFALFGAMVADSDE